MRAKNRDDLKLKLIEGGMGEHTAAQAAEILTPDEPEVSPLTRKAVSDRQDQAERHRRFFGREAS